MPERAFAQSILEACETPAERRKLMNGPLADIWKDLRDALADLSHDKCWYCETPIVRDDLVVDHYRPKGAIYEDRTHGGYWWLAVTPRNFRLSCKFCNEIRVDRRTGSRGGKATHFPLLDGGIRATVTDRDTSRELPVILDPIEADDVDFLMYSEDSRAYPKYDEAVDVIAHERAGRTIVILNLNHGRLLKARGQICNQVTEAITRCDVAYRSFLEKRRSGCDAPTLMDARRPYTDAIQRLADYLKDSSAYAGAAKSILRQARQEGREWIDVLL